MLKSDTYNAILVNMGLTLTVKGKINHTSHSTNFNINTFKLSSLSVKWAWK